MKPTRTAGRWIRIAMAMAFGFMNLGHGPIMTFAHAAKHGPVAGVAAEHSHGAAHRHPAPDADRHERDVAADGLATCNAFGCFIMVGAAAVAPPPQAMTPIGKLLPPPSPATLPVFAEPADPPPRLHG